MTYVAEISKTFMTQKCHQTCVQVLSSKQDLSAILKLHFQIGIECRKSDGKSVLP